MEDDDQIQESKPEEETEDKWLIDITEERKNWKEYAIKFYLALMSTIYNHKREEQEDTYIFGCVDCDADYIEVKEFKKLNEIQQFYKDYFTYPGEK